MATASATALILFGSYMDFACHQVAENAPFKIVNFLEGFGAIIFAWGGRQF